MIDRQRMPVIIGRGLDRATGAAAQQPQFPVDTRNAYMRDAKAAIRPGLAGTGYPPLAWGTDILAIVGVKATLDLLYVVFDRDSREIRIYRLDTETGILQTLSSPANGLWGTLNPLADFPVVSATEAAGMVFFGHDEDTIDFRLPVLYYTPNFASPATPGTLTTYLADLTGSGVSEPVYARGVGTYLEYFMAWGYGSSAEPDRAEILRLSKPALPLVLLPPNYVIFGVAKDPIIGTVSVGDAEGGSGILAVAKEDSMFRLVGSNFDNFRPQSHDDKYGAISSRVLITIGTRAFTWASDGAREITLSGTVPIAQPLELISPLPEDFPALGASRMAFAAYDQRRYILAWYFPEPITARVPVPGFALSLWNAADPRWTFFTIEQPILCAGTRIQRDAGTAPPAPTGYVSDIVAEDQGIAGDPQFRRVRLAFTNNAATGSEFVQVFAKPAGGAWSVATIFAVGPSEQVATWDLALPVTAYAIAFRYLNGSTPAVGYEETDPDLWTAPTAADSKSTVTTSAAQVTSFTSSGFAGLATPITFVWESPQPNVPYLLEKDPGTGWETVVADLVATSYPYTVPGAEEGDTIDFRVTPQRGAVAGPVSDVLSVPMVITVGQPAITTHTFSESTAEVTLAWTAASAALQYVVEKDVGAGFVTVATVGNVLGYTYPILPAEANTTVAFRVTGKNGAILGTPSASVNVTCTMTITTPVINFVGAAPDVIGPSQHWKLSVGLGTLATGPITGYDAEWSFNGVVTRTNSVGTCLTYPAQTCDSWNTGLTYPTVQGIHASVRVRGKGAGGIVGLYSAPATVDF